MTPDLTATRIRLAENKLINLGLATGLGLHWLNLLEWHAERVCALETSEAASWAAGATRTLDVRPLVLRELVEAIEGYAPGSVDLGGGWTLLDNSDQGRAELKGDLVAADRAVAEFERRNSPAPSPETCEVPSGMVLVPITAVREVLDYEAVKLHSPCEHSWECTSEGGADVLRAAVDAVTRSATPAPGISDEAVDAASNLLGYGSTEGQFREHIRRVLAAAAPFMGGAQ